MSDHDLGENIAKLGFGLMRLPMVDAGNLDSEVDMEQLKKMVDLFLKRGFTYFDTAYVYGGGKSELAAREALVKRYPRESYQFADKLPLWGVNSYDELQKLFDTSLERTGVGYFDFYLLHALSKENYENSEKLDAWRFMKGIKSKGLVKHIGFSFHDSPEVLDEILTAHPEAEFVQLQINYADWDNEIVQSRHCYETVRRHNKPVIIMEPVRGGSLANMNSEIQKIFYGVHPDASVASWAIRFAVSLDGVITVLSGMSDISQLDDNTKCVKKLRPLDSAEKDTIAKVVKILRSIPTVPCTACRYCVEGCPQKIDIPAIFRVLNDFKIYHNASEGKNGYQMATDDGGKASDCLQCGSCQSHCPQHIEIIETLKEAAKTFEA